MACAAEAPLAPGFGPAGLAPLAAPDPGLVASAGVAVVAVAAAEAPLAFGLAMDFGLALAFAVADFAAFAAPAGAPPGRGSDAEVSALAAPAFAGPASGGVATAAPGVAAAAVGVVAARVASLSLAERGTGPDPLSLPSPSTNVSTTKTAIPTSSPSRNAPKKPKPPTHMNSTKNTTAKAAEMISTVDIGIRLSMELMIVPPNSALNVPAIST